MSNIIELSLCVTGAIVWTILGITLLIYVVSYLFSVILKVFFPHKALEYEPMEDVIND